MLGNCDQMLLVPSPTTNQWPHQNQIQIDDGKVSMVSSGNNKVMEKPGGTTQDLQAQQQQQQQQALKCPRCDSSNTKFCYYNNYSLSQPRHFCKACKRYWTRGGTLRNVPVGGGCRKNKRVFKRPTNINDTTGTSTSTSTSTSAAVSSSSPSSPSAPSSATSSQLPQIDTASTSNHISPVFYGLPASNSCDVNLLPFSRLFNSRIISGSSGYGLHHHQPPQLNNNGIGLGFSSGFMSSTEASTTDNGYRNNGFTSNNTTFLSGYDSIFTSSCASSTTVVPSLLSSKFFNEGVKDGSGGNPFLQGLGAPVEEEDLQRASSNGTTEAGVVGLKGVVKVEGRNRLEYWNGSACQNQNMEHVGLYDPSLYNWNTAASAMGTVWNDQPNIGPSVTSLI